MLRWWDRRTAAQVHLLAMAWITVLVVLTAGFWSAVELYRLWPVLWWMWPVGGAVVPQLVLRWRLRGKHQVRLLRRALAEVGGAPSGADVERWRAYLTSRMRHHSRTWRRITIAYTLAILAAALVATHGLQIDAEDLTRGVVVAGVALLISAPFIVQARRDNPRNNPDPIADMQYVLDHLPASTRDTETTG